MNIPRLPFVTCRFTLTGLNLERFMNTLQKEGVPLLSARRTGARTLECTCYLRDLPRVRQLAGEKGWRVQRARPAQLAALWAALKKRPGALLGAALALAAAVDTPGPGRLRSPPAQDTPSSWARAGPRAAMPAATVPLLD